jgi:hypothetical protein
MKKRILQSWLLGTVILCAVSPARAFDVVDRQTSFSDSKFVSLAAGFGLTGFSHQKGISGNTGFGFKVSAGHPFSRYLQGEILYQFSTFNWDSPDPVAPASFVKTRASLNQEVIRLIALYPALLAQPFVTVGFGGYQFTGVSQITGLSFPMNFEIPLGAGVRSFVYKNRLSFDVEFNYQILFGENQSPDTLALLGLNKVSFNTYSIMASIVFYMF